MAFKPIIATRCRCPEQQQEKCTIGCVQRLGTATNGQAVCILQDMTDEPHVSPSHSSCTTASNATTSRCLIISDRNTTCWASGFPCGSADAHPGQQLVVLSLHKVRGRVVGSAANSMHSMRSQSTAFQDPPIISHPCREEGGPCKWGGRGTTLAGTPFLSPPRQLKVPSPPLRSFPPAPCLQALDACSAVSPPPSLLPSPSAPPSPTP